MDPNSSHADPYRTAIGDVLRSLGRTPVALALKGFARPVPVGQIRSLRTPAE